MLLVDGKQIADQILAELKSKISTLSRPPKLAVFLVGQNPASVSYVEAKQKKALEIGLAVELKKFDESISQRELQDEIRNVKDADGIIVQLPLPTHIDRQAVLDEVPPGLDVDVLTTKNKVSLSEGAYIPFDPPAAAAVLKILDDYKVDLKDKNILIVGSGELVGQPLATLLLKRGISFELANKFTENTAELMGKADVVISGVGKEKLVTGEMIKEGAVVIDAGTAGSEAGEIKGDVDTETVSAKASLLSPVPGGVGPVTIAMLFQNVTKSALDRQKASL